MVKELCFQLVSQNMFFAQLRKNMIKVLKNISPEKCIDMVNYLINCMKYVETNEGRHLFINKDVGIFK